jgi:excinuclease UvrABC nuclease subunit
LKADLEKKMFEYADNLQFEKAAWMRDYIDGLDGGSEEGPS